MLLNCYKKTTFAPSNCLNMCNRFNVIKQVGLFLFLFVFLVFCFTNNAKAQQPKTRIAVFTPIYIDSAFNGNTYKIWGNYIPKNMLPGLEFYNGVMLAIDSLKSDSTGNLIVDIYDYRSKNNSLNDIISKSASKLAKTKVIIASFDNRSDIKILADYAKQQQIPLISATYPNDGGISNNPYFFLLNSTLRTHCKAMYQYLQKQYASDNIIYLTRKGGFETIVQNYFSEYDANNPAKALELRAKIFSDSFEVKELTDLLDSTRNNIVLCATVNEPFSYRVINALSLQSKYNAKVFGMPTWDGLKNLNKSQYQGVEVVYTSPYNYSPTDSLLMSVTKKYKNIYNAKPSDIVLKGYETMLRIGKTFSLYNTGAIQLFSDDLFKVFNSLDIQPYFTDTTNTEINYYENNKIYFISKVNGVVKNVK